MTTNAEVTEADGAPGGTGELEQFDLSSVQREMYWDDRPTLCFFGGRGTGKSTAACLRIRGMIDRGELGAGERIMICGPDYTQLMDGTIKTFDYWFEDLITHSVEGNKPRRVLRGDIEVLCRSGMNPDQTRSKECRLVWLDEAAQMDESMHSLANMNLRPTGVRFKDDKRVYQLIMTTTPRGQNWLYRLYGQKLLNAANDGSDAGLWHMTTLQAFREGVTTEQYVNRIPYPPGSVMWQQEIEAEFVSWSGRVFTNAKVVSQLPKFACVYGGVDVGGPQPTAIELAGLTEAGAIYIFGEAYQPRMQLHDIVRLVGEKHREHKVRQWNVDNDIIWRMIRAGGMPCRPPNKTKDATGAAISYINSLIARGMFFIHESCIGLLHEWNTYEYKDIQSGDEVTFLDKVKPNQLDHGIDAAKYALFPLSSAKAAQQYGKSVGFAIG